MKKILAIFSTVLIIFPTYSCSSGNLVHKETYSTGQEKYDDIKIVVEKLNTRMDELFRKKVEQLSTEDLLAGYGFSDSDKVVEYLDKKAKKMSLEYTLRLYDETFENFISKISPNDWGLYLDKLIGRGISDEVTNQEGLVIRQIERMVLKSFPFNMDMTKTEVIEYKEDEITVFWRVFQSENKSTLADVGSVSFIKKDDKTLVVFRSAHLLGSNPLVEIAIPNLPIIQKQIKDTFLNHLENYKKRIEAM
ncbi:MAG: hypothetical protein A2381_04845 [Bdellovibrionales bacterium RIFOXYB1_FULL_37_110]|nr:MAG: hypothetical protein A2181_01275 [Bdellovibrionales bacterium RIFOXYA1_FULL_38_20]OFZ50512.1 MAG: hypothetical protein A2417_10825 [Bdellovibrionales bacterium RIFOXYC1_FULL_37_79]OFZ60783.1 MAG: hypothetical protein A2381_04845 [Bdellovibrionales bacterium RIFOXYB1_FULL_37_110]OFZ64497.1 MAG: hypothetical protein A2577_08810 [Bdellovibrionales bacterium RIFOXYD1_FULL_36_51]